MKGKLLRVLAVVILALSLTSCVQQPQNSRKPKLALQFEVALSKSSITTTGEGLSDGQFESYSEEIDGKNFLTTSFIGRGELCRLSVSRETNPATIILVNSIPVSIKFDVPVRIDAELDQLDADRIPPGEHTLKVSKLEGSATK